jgi:hypothetical protein
MLDPIKQGVEQLQIRHAHIAALSRQAISDTLILTLRDLHDPTLPALPPVVN